MITRRWIGGAFAAGLALGLGGRALADDDDDDTPQNVFISPCGKPFRAKPTEPYPVAVWFSQANKKGDGKLDRAEFMADTEAFFKILDLNGDGVIDPHEVARYERGIAPEILGFRVKVADARPVGGLWGGRLWRAQIDTPGPIDPGGAEPPEARPPHDIDESGQGASPYGFFSEPEPVMAADENLDGYIRKPAFLRLAGRHFDRLDPDGVGYLTLARLPKTQAQIRVDRYQRHGHRS
jgi:hypothetical protein